MPLLKEFSTPLMAVWQITEDAATLSALLQDPSAPAEIARMKCEARRCEYLTCRLLLKHLLGHRVEVRHRENGAPCLPFEPYRVSFTHTKNYAAVILSEEGTPGIDMEYKGDRVRRIRKYFLTPEENDALPESCALEELLLRWCAKEAYYKMLPDVAPGWLTRFAVKPFSFSENEGTLSIYDSATEKADFTRLHYRITSCFVLVYSDERLR